LIVRAAIVVEPETASRVAAILTRHLRITDSYDTGIAFLITDLTAVALGNGDASPSSPPATDALTIAQYARLIGLTPGAARKRARTGAVSARKERGRWRISPPPSVRAERS
jgi:hypothetical protein